MNRRQSEVVIDALSVVLKTRKKVFEMFEVMGQNRWEKWLQVELAFKLQDFGEPEFEAIHSYDKRKKIPIKRAENSNFQIDLQFRESRKVKSHITAIELKFNATYKGLRAVLGDLKRIAAVKDWRFRSIIAVLVCPNQDLANNKASKYGNLIRLLQDQELAKIITKHGYSYVVIAWEEGGNKRAKMTKEKYGKWIKYLESIYSAEKITIPKVARKNPKTP